MRRQSSNQAARRNPPRQPADYEKENNTFYYRTKLSNRRMTQISDWIGALPKDQRELLKDLLDDTYQSGFDQGQHEFARMF